tara:strand:+ start:197 stop:670 length:474 start_codon:yes stop_codon:yes gene_type:complete
MKKILLISLSLLFAGEMEVDGGLTVSGQVNASSFSGDGSALTNLPSLGDQKPERIYSYKYYDSGTFLLTVPSNKIWKIELALGTSASGTMGVNNNGNGHTFDYTQRDYTFWLLPNNTFGSYDTSGGNPSYVGKYTLTIFEYPISGSGNDQGMDYVIP